MKKTSTFLAAFLFTAGMAFAQSNEATATQEGNNNEVSISQVGASNVATSTQTGNGSLISIEQIGAENAATASHRGNGSIEQFQDGSDNSAYAFAGDNGTIRQLQFGSENTALAGVSRNAVIQNSSVFQYQRGTGNYAEVETRQGNGRNNSIFQAQAGNDNEAVVLDMGNGNDVRQVQIGDGNVSTAGLTSNPQLGGMNILTRQVGDDNIATVWGSQNDYAEIKQFGNGNVGFISQDAGSDHAVIYQNGYSNNATITQQ